MDQRLKLSKLLYYLLLQSHVSHREVGEAEDWFEYAGLDARAFKICICKHASLRLRGQRVPEYCLS